MLREFPGPVLILNGERDSSARRGEARFAAAPRQGRLQHIPDAGHACSLDRPDAFDQAVCDFARSIRGDAGGEGLGGTGRRRHPRGGCDGAEQRRDDGRLGPLRRHVMVHDSECSGAGGTWRDLATDDCRVP